MKNKSMDKNLLVRTKQRITLLRKIRQQRHEILGHVRKAPQKPSKHWAMAKQEPSIVIKQLVRRTCCEFAQQRNGLLGEFDQPIRHR